MVKITIDLSLCAGHGQCEDAAPEVFEVNDEGFAVLRMSEVSDPELERKVADAATRCPTGAITIVASAAASSGA
jgi:ferredoxin